MSLDSTEHPTSQQISSLQRLQRWKLSISTSSDHFPTTASLERNRESLRSKNASAVSSDGVTEFDSPSKSNVTPRDRSAEGSCVTCSTRRWLAFSETHDSRVAGSRSRTRVEAMSNVSFEKQRMLRGRCRKGGARTSAAATLESASADQTNLTLPFAPPCSDARPA